ncbi:50S ribosomal protein L34 [Candidatus Woesebacteria bacterium RIFCSPHIGHO2_01_FULL_39_32]|uniref:Large ribosomal subunit protein bL34 n=1 Tax=Candidatus Woesebacteria bacterium RIFCSPLOWO2_01_FULL_39_25 TaxID=1802521 RepID=A0A1F8BL09_9BACT|nr:MAG: 50S ribosomal protein L34 [Candidatus Woesebacteria bacterium RIFCSPHIGHO2_01_FULL_39_32]OGM36631.1 MAG: 50S ribosomal protein L34 [Candidatus Woesebacteria bacterium RIFCSPHIGHO2_12_FULL_38_11]OGM63958.1 MAG: 50S ribosomal protein L34 [Candidatus Woesebacteria bacterium RIFCSPLOWO2_01_FULL_39_25]
MPKRTLQPSKSRKVKRHGFRKRMAYSKGRLVLKRRMKKGRKIIS